MEERAAAIVNNNHATVNIEGIGPCRALLDLGADVSCIRPDILPRKFTRFTTPSDNPIFAANGSQLKQGSICTLNVSLKY